MRLLEDESAKIYELLSQYGLIDLGLINKKGWVHIEVNGQSFAFHRKKTSTLMNGVFINGYQYYVKTDKTATEVDGLEMVLDLLSEWLNSQT